MRADVILRQVSLGAEQLFDVAVIDGQIMAIGERLKSKGPEWDGKGQLLLPGLIDHHIHLLATAAQMSSVDLSGCRDPAVVANRLRNAPSQAGGWVRAIGYDEAVKGLADRALLDSWMPDRPLRMQDRTGALWMLNSLAVERLGSGPFPDGVDISRGHIWRQDRWLRERLGGEAPSLVALGAELARYGIIGVSDAGAQNGPEEAALLMNAMPQKLMIMGREDMPASPHYLRGPLKLLYDERDLPDPHHVAERIYSAREQGRAVAAHVVTVAELLLYLAALELAGGARPGDRIEHGSLIPEALIADIARSGLTLVTQPGFIASRGDRYLDEVDPQDLPDLYRLCSLIKAGIPLAAGSDAPYADINPWTAIRAAQSRRTALGQVIGSGESLTAKQALNLYLGDFKAPGGPPRMIKVGCPADVILINPEADNPVTLTMIAGRILTCHPAPDPYSTIFAQRDRIRV